MLIVRATPYAKKSNDDSTIKILKIQSFFFVLGPELKLINFLLLYSVTPVPHCTDFHYQIKKSK